IGKSKLMIFQSLFEGFGYPPIEAQYLDCQCVAYDLPVLREFSDEHVNFVEHGNPEAMRLAIAAVLRGDHVTPTDLYPNVAELGSVAGFARRIQSEIFDNDGIAGGQVRKFRRDMFLHLSEQYEQHKEAIHAPVDGMLDIDPGSFAGILAKHFRALADELAAKSAGAEDKG
ncbi:MAG: glycosyltransferase, partial [Pseudomonadota bacterium]